MGSGGDDPDPVRSLHSVRPRAYVYLRDIADGAACLDYCAARGYEVIGVVYDPDGSKYAGVYEQLHQGGGELIVAADVKDLPPDRTPRVEVVARPPVRDTPSPPDRRPSPVTPLRRRRPRPTR